MHGNFAFIIDEPSMVTETKRDMAEQKRECSCLILSSRPYNRPTIAFVAVSNWENKDKKHESDKHNIDQYVGFYVVNKAHLLWARF